MIRYILDTDTVTQQQQGNSRVFERLKSVNPQQIYTTSITAYEQLRGRLAFINNANEGNRLPYAHFQLLQTLSYYRFVQILPFDDVALAQLQQLRAQKIRVGTQDLHIASITLAVGGVLVTRNYRDFQRVPELALENWIDG